MHLSTRLSLILPLVAAATCTDHARQTAPRATAPAAKSSATKHTNAPVAPDATPRLAALDSSVTWEPQSVLVADIDCDGKPDSAFVGRGTDRIAVGVIRATAATPEILLFGTKDGPADALSANTARLTLESLDYDPREADMGEIEGFQRSKTCQGLELADGDVDPMHMFWNHASQHLDWWRE